MVEKPMNFKGNPSLAVRTELASQLYELRGTPPMSTLNALLDVLISEARELNDTIGINDLQRNQGRIEAYSQLKHYIASGAVVCSAPTRKS